MTEEILASLQYLLLSLLWDEQWKTGAQLRAALAEAKQPKSRAAFSSLVVRLEAAELLVSEEIPGDNSHAIAPRRYRITDRGRAMVRTTFEVLDYARRQHPDIDLLRSPALDLT